LAKESAAVTVPPFESEAEQALRNTQSNGGDESNAQVVAYIDQSGIPREFTGDDAGPYVLDVFRASEDGFTGLPAVESGQDQRPATDLYGRIWVVEAPPTTAQAYLRYRSAALEQVAVVAIGPTGHFIVEDIRMIISPGVSADRHLMLFDKATNPVNGNAPIWSAVLPNQGAGSGEVWDSFKPIAVTTGLAVAVSTTPLTLTLPGSAQAIFQILYRAVP
jgi:hypothetical protein